MAGSLVERNSRRKIDLYRLFCDSLEGIKHQTWRHQMMGNARKFSIKISVLNKLFKIKISKSLFAVPDPWHIYWNIEEDFSELEHLCCCAV